ncbi:hypothetical protein C2G38_452577 [Gigaspora rosea]|uniref:Uncharacterized protein n=1 Tax=Gigaspora rosea TaxID=44941 RepID=A0A397W6E3_9GLOM|nr:hypothetical protein C2G38_452577 [Gigaspora rosea]
MKIENRFNILGSVLNIFEWNSILCRFNILGLVLNIFKWSSILCHFNMLGLVLNIFEWNSNGLFYIVFHLDASNLQKIHTKFCVQASVFCFRIYLYNVEYYLQLYY